MRVVAHLSTESEINVGDVAHIRAERHWHGAKADTRTGHITITLVGSKATGPKVNGLPLDVSLVCWVGGSESWACAGSKTVSCSCKGQEKRHAHRRVGRTLHRSSRCQPHRSGRHSPPRFSRAGYRLGSDHQAE